MTPGIPAELSFTVNLAQLFMLGGCIWGLARMSTNLSTLTLVSDQLVKGLKAVETALAVLAGRVGILEDRSRRFRADDGL